MKSKILFDIEFTGLDNSYILDNEIIQVKMKNLSNGETFFKNFGSVKSLSAHCQIEHGVPFYNEDLFSREVFLYALNEIGADLSDEFIGFGISKDLEMLRKYNISLLVTTDIRELFQCSQHEFRIATEGSGLEEIYFIATGKIPVLKHSDISELSIIEELDFISQTLKLNTHLRYMPFGHCAGMPIHLYVEEYRRAADGYRYNNHDLLSRSMNHWISAVEEPVYSPYIEIENADEPF